MYPYKWIRKPRGSNYWARKRKDIEVFGIDTETIDGKCKLIADSMGNKMTIEDFDDILKFLCYYKHRGKLGFFWNIKYDVQALMKHLPPPYIKHFYKTHYLYWKDHQLTLIPNKCLKIRRNKHLYQFYDMAQFYYNAPLQKMAKQELGKSKNDLDASKLNNKQFWEDNQDRIVKYCAKDCKLTAQLAQKRRNQFEDMGVTFQRPYSPATLGERYALQNSSIPKFKNREYQRYAYLAYHAGRFEIGKRGQFDKVYKFDIHSAYPSALVSLPDIRKGFWFYKEEYEPEANLGFLKVKIKDCYGPYGPLPFDRTGSKYFPEIEEATTFITKREYDFIENNYNADLEVINAWFWKAEKLAYPFKYLKKLYEQKEEVKGKNPELYNVIKLLMNSVYGKLIQVTPIMKKVKEKPNLKVYKDMAEANQAENHLFKTAPKIYTSPLEKQKGIYQQILQAGRLFNPVYAALTTANARLQLLDKALKYSDSLISMLTDSITLTKKKISTGENLGEWELEKQGKMINLQAGVYTIENKNDVVTKLRGFKTHRKRSLFNMLRDNANKKKIVGNIRKPVSWGEALLSNSMSLGKEMNMFLTKKKAIDINADNKRKWNRDFDSCKDALNNKIDSKPLRYSS